MCGCDCGVWRSRRACPPVKHQSKKPLSAARRIISITRLRTRRAAGAPPLLADVASIAW